MILQMAVMPRLHEEGPPHRPPIHQERPSEPFQQNPVPLSSLLRVFLGQSRQTKPLNRYPHWWRQISILSRSPTEAILRWEEGEVL